jgi:hypothetical protein
MTLLILRPDGHIELAYRIRVSVYWLHRECTWAYSMTEVKLRGRIIDCWKTGDES